MIITKEGILSHYPRPIAIYAFLFYGFFNMVELITWLNIHGLNSVKLGEISVFQFLLNTLLPILIFISAILLIFKSKHAIKLSFLSTLLGTAIVLQPLFRDVRHINLWMHPTPEQMLILTSTLFYCIHLKSKSYYRQ